MVTALENDDDKALMALTGQDDGQPRDELSKLAINLKRKRTLDNL